MFTLVIKGKGFQSFNEENFEKAKQEAVKIFDIPEEDIQDAWETNARGSFPVKSTDKYSGY